MPKGIILTDRISVPSKRTLTDAGQMHVPCKFARTGSQLYTAKQLGLADRDPDEIITLYRDASDVFDEASVESFRSAPVTLGHPVNDEGEKIQVTAENSKQLQVGMLEGMPVRDEDTLGGTLILTAQEAIDALNEGTQELSAGYVCDVEEVDGKLYQRNIKANHIAIVAKGRAGANCRISDEAGVLIEDAYIQVQTELGDAKAEVASLKEELEAQKQLVVDFKAGAEESEILLAKSNLELADAIKAANQDVVARCTAMENARLIADMRDLGSKSVEEIHRLVVEDQMPEKDFEGKSSEYMSAMFEILVDASTSETPMGKLLKSQEVHTIVDSKQVNKAEEARQRMINRQKEAHK